MAEQGIALSEARSYYTCLWVLCSVSWSYRPGLLLRFASQQAPESLSEPAAVLWDAEFAGVIRRRRC